MNGQLQSEDRKVQGFCPNCGQPTLFLGNGGYVTCSNTDCSRPDSVSLLLKDSETEHLVTFREEEFTVQHPLRERVDGSLHKCRLHQEIEALGGPPDEPGLYRVTLHHPDPVSESFRGSDSLGGWDLERLGDVPE